MAVTIKVTWLPRQEGLEDAEIEMLTGCTGLTIIVKAFDVAVLMVTQVEFDVMKHVTISPFTGV